jgi:glycosyltransferase involved in cell wall biosynthesis
MKIAVYAIAKNEEQFVQRWADSCADADSRFILDTGSTDRTRELANQCGVDYQLKQFFPWRFDIARNDALAHIPADIDYCIALDMDEVLQPGWRQALETFLAANPTVTRPRYKYVWSWNPDGTEGLVYGGDKIHHRDNYTWRHPVHEVLTPLDGETQGFVPGLEIHHHPDSNKSRAQYLPLLELAVKEDPSDPRNQFYLGREYFYQGNKQLAIKHLVSATLLGDWPPEKAAAYRMLYKLSGQLIDLYRALMQDPCRRETLVALAQHYHDQQNWRACYQYANAALLITEKPLDYLCEADAWGWLPYDLAAVSSWHLGRRHEAKTYGEQAVLLNPCDDRLRANMEWYTQGNPV